MEYKVIEGNEIIIEETSFINKESVIEGMKKIIKRNCYKIEKIEETALDVKIYVV